MQSTPNTFRLGKLLRQLQIPVETVGLAFHLRPRAAVERRPYWVLRNRSVCGGASYTASFVGDSGPIAAQRSRVGRRLHRRGHRFVGAARIAPASRQLRWCITRRREPWQWVGNVQPSERAIAATLPRRSSARRGRNKNARLSFTPHTDRLPRFVIAVPAAPRRMALASGSAVQRREVRRLGDGCRVPFHPHRRFQTVRRSRRHAGQTAGRSSCGLRRPCRDTDGPAATHR